MKLLQVIFISIVQGISEFLPISSSGHILLLKKLFNRTDLPLEFDIIIHLGTLMAVILVYRVEIYELIRGLFVNEVNSSLFSRTLYRKDVFKIYAIFIVATIPAVFSGLFLEDYIESFISGSSNKGFFAVALFFGITCILLIITKFIKEKKESHDITNISFLQSLIIGLFQAFAVLPGVSRSGSTISGALISGVKREEAGRFSFLLSIPVIFGAFLLELVKIFQEERYAQGNLIYYLVGFFVSFVVGYFSLKLLLNIIKKGKLHFFAFYMLLPIMISLFLAIR